MFSRSASPKSTSFRQTGHGLRHRAEVGLPGTPSTPTLLVWPAHLRGRSYCEKLEGKIHHLQRREAPLTEYGSQPARQRNMRQIRLEKRAAGHM